MFELSVLFLLSCSSLMRKSEYSGFISFFALAACIFSLRALPDTPWTLAYATLSVFLFWVTQSVRFSFSNIRSLVVLTLGLAFALFVFRDFLPSTGRAATGSWSGFDLNPAMIESLQNSHEKALEVYFDHPPTADERYFRVNALSETQNGLDYRMGARAPLDLNRFPDAVKWAKSNLKENNLEQDLKSIQNWWSESFVYSLKPGALEKPDPLDEFLFERKKGFCEHYAAALATLLKIENFDARVAVGFLGGSWNRLTRKLTFEMADAHAWVEVFDAKKNQWLRVDPTTWVFAEKTESRTETSWIWIGLGVIFLLACLWIFGNKRPLTESLLNAVTRLEKSHHQKSAGLTLRERLMNLAVTDPRNQNFYSRLVVEYHEYQFAKDRRPEIERSLRKQIIKLKLFRFRRV